MKAASSMGVLASQSRRAVVGFSGGVTSAWVAGWALRTYPKEEVVLLFHDTKEEHPDTYRFITEMAAALGHPITERSDGRSVTQVAEDEGALPNNRMAFCSRILKAEQRDKYLQELRDCGVTEIINHVGFSSIEWQRIQRTTIRAEADGYKVRFPVVEEGVSKQDCADWCMSLGVRPSAMYEWSEHANCIGCARGGKAYWLAVAENHPVVYKQRCQLEVDFGHTFLSDMSLVELKTTGLKRAVSQREKITINCECGD